jgi:hypothetical protein
MLFEQYLQALDEGDLKNFWKMYKKNRATIHAKERQAAKTTRHKMLRFVKGR